MNSTATVAIEAYADWFTENERKHHQSHNPERLARLLAENPEALNEYRETWIKKGEQLANDILARTDEFCKKANYGAFHPSNKATRALFTAITGVSLPSTVGGTHAAIQAYGGEELAAHNAELAIKEQTADAERLAEQQAKREKQLAQCREDFTAGKFIDGEDFLELARDLGFDVHPRTAGSLRRRVTGINISGNMRLRQTSKIPAGVAALFHEVKSALSQSLRSK